MWSYSQTDGLGIAPEAQETRQTNRWFQGFILESLLTDSLVFRTQAGLTGKPEIIYPNRCRSDPGNCEFIPSSTNNFPVFQSLENAPRSQRSDNTIFQFRNRFEWFADSRFGEHTLTLQDFFFAEEQIAKRSVPGDMITEMTGQLPVARTFYYSNDPRYDTEERLGWFVKTTNVYRHITTLSDSWRPTRYLTLTLGGSHIYATGSNSRGDKALVRQMFVPSIGAAWDAAHDGRTVIRSSFNVYADIAIGGGAGTAVDPVADHTAGSQLAKRCPWDAANNRFSDNCTYTGGLTRNTFRIAVWPERAQSGRHLLPRGAPGADDDGIHLRRRA